MEPWRDSILQSRESPSPALNPIIPSKRALRLCGDGKTKKMSKIRLMHHQRLVTAAWTSVFISTNVTLAPFLQQWWSTAHYVAFTVVQTFQYSISLSFSRSLCPGMMGLVVYCLCRDVWWEGETWAWSFSCTFYIFLSHCVPPPQNYCLFYCWLVSYAGRPAGQRTIPNSLTLGSLHSSDSTHACGCDMAHYQSLTILYWYVDSACSMD